LTRIALFENLLDRIGVVNLGSLRVFFLARERFFVQEISFANPKKSFVKGTGRG